MGHGQNKVPASPAKIMDTAPKSRRLHVSPASLNANGMKDRDKAARLLRDVLSNAVDVDAIQETHFVFKVVACVLSNNFFVFSEYGYRLVRSVSLPVRARTRRWRGFVARGRYCRKKSFVPDDCGLCT